MKARWLVLVGVAFPVASIGLFYPRWHTDQLIRAVHDAKGTAEWGHACYRLGGAFDRNGLLFDRRCLLDHLGRNETSVYCYALLEARYGLPENLRARASKGEGCYPIWERDRDGNWNLAMHRVPDADLPALRAYWADRISRE
jgi:hypothetical protein